MGLPGPLPADGHVAAGDEHSFHLHILDVTEGEGQVKLHAFTLLSPAQGFSITLGTVFAVVKV